MNPGEIAASRSPPPPPAGGRRSLSATLKGRSRAGLGFAGYAAVFDRPDLGGDVIRRGAFREGLGGRIPLLWEHGRAVGRIERVEEDAKGLRVIGRIGEARAGEAVARGDVRGLSVGYRVRAARGEGPRELIELALVEVSLVARPMQPLARVHALEAECDRSCECEESRSRR